MNTTGKIYAAWLPFVVFFLFDGCSQTTSETNIALHGKSSFESEKSTEKIRCDNFPSPQQLELVPVRSIESPDGSRSQLMVRNLICSDTNINYAHRIAKFWIDSPSVLDGIVCYNVVVKANFNAFCRVMEERLRKDLVDFKQQSRRKIGNEGEEVNSDAIDLMLDAHYLAGDVDILKRGVPSRKKGSPVTTPLETENFN